MATALVAVLLAHCPIAMDWSPVAFEPPVPVPLPPPIATDALPLEVASSPRAKAPLPLARAFEPIATELLPDAFAILPIATL
jgi:hypothetical protein